MHLIEASSLYLVIPNEQPLENTLAVKRRLFAIARHFNIWISYELGRTRVKLPTATTRLRLSDTANQTKDVFSFSGLSVGLDNEITELANTSESSCRH